MAEMKARLVFKDVDAQQEVGRISFEDDWTFLDVSDPDSETFVNIWESSDGAVEIHFVKDSLVGLEYLNFYGDDVTQVQRQIEEQSSFWSTDDALLKISQASNRDDRLTSVYAAALSAFGRQSDALISEFRAVSQDDDPGVRQSVVIATGYLQVPALIEVVAGMANSDPVDLVRENARILLEGIRLERQGKLQS